MDKVSLRQRMRAERARCDPSLGHQLSRWLLDSDLIGAGAVLAGYWPIDGEIDIRDALIGACARGTAVGLPITPRPGAPLVFRTWHPGSTLRPGRFGTSEPDGPFLVPTVLLVPLLAFDRGGGRLGYGGGFYDRTLAALPASVAIGCAFAAQEMDRVPMETHDRRLHAIATEAGVIIVE